MSEQQREQGRAQAPDQHDGEKTITYHVNGEPQTTTEHKLPVRTILENAGFEPTTDWVLSRDKDGHDFAHQDELVTIHKDERFTATFTGPTPAS
jgi:hypothetical protein